MITKYTALMRQLTEEKKEIERGEKILAKRKLEVLAMIDEIQKVQKDFKRSYVFESSCQIFEPLSSALPFS